MMCLQVPSGDNDTQLENCLQTMDVWVSFLNVINAHEAMNLAGREATKKPMAVTGMEEDGGSSVSPTDSTWACVFAPSLSTFLRDVAGLKTLGRPNRRRVAWVDSDNMTVIEPKPTTDLAALQPNLEPVWNGHMAQYWKWVHSQLQVLGKGVKDCREENRKGLEYVDQEISSNSNKIALLDTRIRINPTASGIVSVWEAKRMSSLMGGFWKLISPTWRRGSTLPNL
jgi:hypothetical protein